MELYSISQEMHHFIEFYFIFELVLDSYLSTSTKNNKNNDVKVKETITNSALQQRETLPLVDEEPLMYHNPFMEERIQ